MAELFVQSMAVAVEPDPPYVDGLPELAGMFDDSVDVEAMAAQLRTVAEVAGIPPHRLRRLAAPRDGAEPVDRVLHAIGAPAAPQPVLLVQEGPDRDPFATTLPRLIHQAPWPVTEELTLTHLGADAGCELLDFLSWWLEPAVGATVLLSHQPVFVDAARLPARLTAVALRFGDTGPLAVLDWRATGQPSATACEGWPEVYALLTGDWLSPGDTFEIQSGGALIRLKYVGDEDPADPRSPAPAPLVLAELGGTP
ncbi:hypothetical protein O7626_04055 [Micromonospora sp. WMMD1102]|uniref:hypothetical protein n=1 Tax=Micromonospora sp. WMMD1102 TaxID=3016105 RepID=UPI002414D2F3|nr:hypothetical protein [Micromonospora sp. WMMD1102]MDG4785112.1 hypothetical protein [Micromonospora sp. WMMD1102]